VDQSGNAYVTGTASSTNFPTANPIQGTKAGTASGNDAFVTKINAAGSALVYSTYLGGSGGEEGHGIAVDSAGNAYVGGYTTSTDFPIPNAIQGTNGGGNDAFVTKIDAAGSTLLYSTYIGGSSHEFASGLALDAAGSAYLVGHSFSTNFPVTANPLQGNKSGNWDVFCNEGQPERLGSRLLHLPWRLNG
jgi:hypothetical protein